MATPIPANKPVNKQILLAQAPDNENKDPVLDAQETPPPPVEQAPPPPPPPATFPVPGPGPRNVIPRPTEEKPVETLKIKDSTVHTGPSVWDRFGVVIGGGPSLAGMKIRPSVKPFSDAAPNYNGSFVFFQPTYRVLDNPKYNLRAGGDIRLGLLGVADQEISPPSSVKTLSVGALIEANYTPHWMFGIGAGISFAYHGVMSKDADIGTPFSATLSLGEDKNFMIGAQLFISTLNEVIRAGAGLDAMVGGFNIDTTPGGHKLNTTMDHHFYFFVGADLIRGGRELGKLIKKK